MKLLSRSRNHGSYHNCRKKSRIFRTDKISIDYHFVSIFGNAREKLETRWRDKGGLQGYSNHVKEVVKKFDHITLLGDR